MKNYYQILSVSPKATVLEIKTAFKLLALRHHPDQNPDNPEAEEHFKEINEAYQTLINSEKRLIYDAKLRYANAYSPSHTVSRTPARPFVAVEDDDGIPKHIKRRVQFLSAAFFIGFIAFAAYFHGFMNRYTARIHLQDAIISWQNGQYVIALSEIHKSLAFDGALAEAYFLRAAIYAEEYDNYRKAVVEWDKGMRLTNEFHAGLWLQRAEWNLKAENYRNAIKDYDRAIALQGINGQLYLQRALIKMELATKQQRASGDACQDFATAIRLGVVEAFPYYKAYCQRQ